MASSGGRKQRQKPEQCQPSSEDEASTLLTDELLSTREPPSWNPHLTDLEQLKRQVDRLIAENYLLKRQLNLLQENSSLRVANLIGTVISWLDDGATGLNVAVKRKDDHLISVTQRTEQSSIETSRAPDKTQRDFTTPCDGGPFSMREFESAQQEKVVLSRENSKMTPETLQSILTRMPDALPIAASPTVPGPLNTPSLTITTVANKYAEEQHDEDSYSLHVPNPRENITITRGYPEPPPWHELETPPLSTLEPKKPTMKVPVTPKPAPGPPVPTRPRPKQLEMVAESEGKPQWSQRQEQKQKSTSFKQAPGVENLSDSDLEASQNILYASLDSDTDIQATPVPERTNKSSGFTWERRTQPATLQRQPVATSTPIRDQAVVEPSFSLPSPEQDKSRSITDDLRSTAHSKNGGRRILGEIAYQLDRRILNFVFKKEDDDPKQRKKRLYGYMVQNIPAKIQEECTDKISGTVDEACKYVLEYRYKHVLYCLGPAGYDFNIHPKFAADVVNKYGLLPVPEKNSALHNLQTNAYVNLRKMIATMTSQEEEKHMTILLNCLVLLAKDDGKPLFIWV